jgi:diphthamide biosynthesis enzyme Dph1/Dph2-like protein
MKVLYLEAKKKSEFKEISSMDFSKLPKKLLLLYSIQYKSKAEAIKKHLEKRGFEIKGFRQVLGCTKIKSDFPILLVGSGEFHAINLGLQNNVAIYIAGSEVIELDRTKVNLLMEKRKNSYSKFLHAKNLGILITTKPGQEKTNTALSLKNKIEKKYPEKKVFLFISNNIDLSQFENFKIDFWINTACPGLFYDSSKIINSDDILDFLA